MPKGYTLCIILFLDVSCIKVDFKQIFSGGVTAIKLSS